MAKLYSRRAILAQIALGTGVAGAGFPVSHAFAASDDRPWAFFTDDEARWTAAVADVFIPQDEFPSASQAGVVDFIDFQMATAYGAGEGLYLDPPFPAGALAEQGYQLEFTPAQLLRQGIEQARQLGDIATMDAPARADHVEEMSNRDDITGTLIVELWKLTKQGYFADPIYLGNHDYAGWRMVGFPGAHAYYTERVDAHKRSVTPPPRGIAHDRDGSPYPPRAIGGGSD
ncbi:gluconate 2-dehydrogenase subunit 3 family protein [Sulfitobacter delicatus]|uniref:Gluconate 2-dehydrogenase gamma chain n=1 Tax=Sulfitobacter delicatus TaxID=218672 RepID=A0A1G7TUI5_9RHOB|nr:gluconate 2-dehydrogenase subunit 3 family protein [Sulfitobacter delicatus]SDG38902.1 gluconate 2-dehydrogenase gamma chain [Sulfitobacter delicatus]